MDPFVIPLAEGAPMVCVGRQCVDMVQLPGEQIGHEVVGPALMGELSCLDDASEVLALGVARRLKGWGGSFQGALPGKQLALECIERMGHGCAFQQGQRLAHGRSGGRMDETDAGRQI